MGIALLGGSDTVVSEATAVGTGVGVFGAGFFDSWCGNVPYPH
jgi:hypothetical protein